MLPAPVQNGTDSAPDTATGLRLGGPDGFQDFEQVVFGDPVDRNVAYLRVGVLFNSLKPHFFRMARLPRGFQ